MSNKTHLEESIESGNIQSVRGALANIVRTDAIMGNNNIDRKINEVRNRGIDVFEPHDTQYDMALDRSKWDDPYFANALTVLRRNFSEERLEHAIAVGAHIRSLKGPKNARRDPPPSPRPVVTANPHTRAGGMPPQTLQRNRRWIAVLTIAVIVIAAIAIILLTKES